MKYWVLTHLLGVVVWVGGMFFAYMTLRPAAASELEPPHRLRLWRETLRRFFYWVWIAVAVILVSGLAMIGQLGGMAQARWHVHTMLALGLIMMAIFGHVYFAPFRRLTRLVTAQDWPAAAAALGQIRRLVGVNLVLGIIALVIALMGRAY